MDTTTNAEKERFLTLLEGMAAEWPKMGEVVRDGFMQGLRNHLRPVNGDPSIIEAMQLLRFGSDHDAQVAFNLLLVTVASA